MAQTNLEKIVINHPTTFFHRIKNAVTSGIFYTVMGLSIVSNNGCSEPSGGGWSGGYPTSGSWAGADGSERIGTNYSIPSGFSFNNSTMPPIDFFFEPMQINNEGDLIALNGKYLDPSKIPRVRIYSDGSVEYYNLSAKRGEVANPSPELESYFNVAIGYEQQGLLDAALKMYKKVIEVVPENAFAHFALGNVYNRLSMPEEAEKQWESAIKINPNYADARNNLAVHYYEEGNYACAIMEWEIVKSFLPQYSNVDMNLKAANQKLQNWLEENLKILKTTDSNQP